ncbi:MAG: hypothetical protein FJ087_22005, partial [Deltaproteobacteria bacterium]|nr:hypothetical protein [Deltaproteobacteria bacterium]
GRLAWAASAAAAGAPADASAWEAWVERVRSTLPDAGVFLLRYEPGRPGFASECAARGIREDEALAAWAEGSRLVTPASPADGGPGPGWTALVRVVASDGTRALLGVSEPPAAAFETSSVWGIWLLYAALAFAVAVAFASLLGFALLVRPVRTAAAAAHKAMPASARDADLLAVRTALEAAAARVRAAETRADRQATELARMRGDLKGAQATLLRAEKLASVGQLAAGIAHEIGNPVGIVLGMAEVLEAGSGSEAETRQFASQIRSAAMRVHNTIKDLLAFARPARDEGASADVPAVLDATVKLLAPQKRFRDVAVESDVRDPDLHAEIRPSQLQQVLVNLLMNAADAMGGRGTVRVTARAEDRWALISPADAGPGIAPEDQSRVFDPFFTTKPPGEGTGLGLPICAQIVDVYGGEIALESRPGEGATFTVRLWRA